jgi:hypothetical protein
MKKFLALITAFSLLSTFLLSFSVSAASVSCSIMVSEDSYSEESDPDTEVGSMNASLITTSNTGGSKPAAANRNVYLKFDVRSYDLTHLTSAKLKMHINTVSNKADRTITVYSVGVVCGGWCHFSSRQTANSLIVPAAASAFEPTKQPSPLPSVRQ